VRINQKISTLVFLGCSFFTLDTGAQSMKLPVQLVSENLPDAPSPALENLQQTINASDSASTASLFGTVQDKNQLAVPNAQLRLENLDNHKVIILRSGENGSFTCSNLVAAHYKITITATGMGIYSQEFELKSGETHIISGIVLPVATEQSEVRVYANKDEIAQEELHIALQQRVFGAFPNFYIAYDWNAPAMTTKQKYKLAAYSIFDPVNLAVTGVVAGVQQAANSYPTYGQGMEGYAKRYGAGFATGSLNIMLGGAVFPALLHQDPRYFYKGTGSVKSRMWYAIYESVLCRGDNGKQQFNYAGILGSLTAGAISNSYYPPSDRGVSLTFVNTLWGTAASVAVNIVQEFLLKRVTTHSNDKAPALQ
jgi:Carboxypeptidase regulatory-like domain